MKAQELGLEITEVPGVEFVRAEPDGESEGGVRIVVGFAGAHTQSWGVREMGEFITVLAAVHHHGQKMWQTDGEDDYDTEEMTTEELAKEGLR